MAARVLACVRVYGGTCVFVCACAWARAARVRVHGVFYTRAFLFVSIILQRR